MKISTVQQMRDMDHAAAQSYAIPESLLMENAGLAAAALLKEKISLPDAKIVVICGSGNNAGDGLVVARQLHSLGSQVSLLMLSDPQQFQESVLLNYQIIQKIGLPCIRITPAMDIGSLLSDASVIVDAIFGTGLTRPVEGLFAAVIQAINASQRPVLSLDIPSGINGDNGKIMGTAVKARWTITFGLPKMGNLLYPGYSHAGELFVSHISFPPDLYDCPEIRCAVNLPVQLPPRQPDGHKGTFGQALFIAGAQNYYGAPYFAAISFLKAGGGYARLACPRSIAPFVAAKGSEIVFIPQDETSAGSLAYSSLENLQKLANQSDIVVLGPGISLQNETQELAQALIQSICKPLLIDGDGLTALSRKLEILNAREAPTIITPHPGEMARLLGVKADRLQSDLVETAREFSQAWNVYLVLKGAHTLIAYPDGYVFLNMTGNSGMGTAGSGDVLTGTIAAMYGLGLDIAEAARKGVFIHGFAGDLASKAIGQDGITAQDILDFIPMALKQDRSADQTAASSLYSGAVLISKSSFITKTIS